VSRRNSGAEFEKVRKEHERRERRNRLQARRAERREAKALRRQMRSEATRPPGVPPPLAVAPNAASGAADTHEANGPA
jgi:hypothetical protein